MSDEPKPLSDAERTEIASELTAEQSLRAPAVQYPTAIFTAGQPGSGKSMIVNRVSVNFEGLGTAPIVIDPDIIRPGLPYMLDCIERGELDIPGVAYGDAGTIAAKMMEKAAEGRRNIIYDGTLSNTFYARQNVEYLTQAGYRVQVHAMAVAPDLSHASTYERRELQIKSSPSGFGRGVGDDFHDQAVKGLAETIGALQADGKLDAIVLYDRQGNTIGSTRMEAGRWVPDEQMAEALKNAQQNPNARTLRDAAASWENASRLMHDRGAEPQEQQKVDAFRDAAISRRPAPAVAAAEFERTCAEVGLQIVARANRLDASLAERGLALNKGHAEIAAAKPNGPGWIPGQAAKVAEWHGRMDASARSIADNVSRRERVAPYTQAPVPGYPSKVDEAAVRKVQRRDPVLAREAMAFRADERQQKAHVMAEARTQQQGQTKRLSR